MTRRARRRGLPGDGRERTPVERAGAPLGARAAPPDRSGRLARRVVDAAVLAIEIARLRVELRRQLAEVEASRARIVAAGYGSAAASSATCTTARSSGSSRSGSRCATPAPARRRLRRGAHAGRRSTEITRAIEELRELATACRPAQLDAGLGPALRELAGRAPLPVEVRRDHGALPVGLEAAAYFVACEGLTNAIKHAHASAVVLQRAAAATGPWW